MILRALRRVGVLFRAPAPAIAAYSIALVATLAFCGFFGMAAVVAATGVFVALVRLDRLSPIARLVSGPAIAGNARVCALAFLAFGVLGVGRAFAAEVSPTVFPVGDFVAALFSTIQPLALATLSWVVARWAPAVIKPMLTDQLLGRALDYAFGAVEGAVKGRTATVPIANELVRQAAEYTRDHGAPWLLRWLGDTIEPKLIARLSAAGALPPEAHAAALLE